MEVEITTKCIFDEWWLETQLTVDDDLIIFHWPMLLFSTWERHTTSILYNTLHNFTGTLHYRLRFGHSPSFKNQRTQKNFISLDWNKCWESCVCRKDDAFNEERLLLFQSCTIKINVGSARTFHCGSLHRSNNYT